MKILLAAVLAGLLAACSAPPEPQAPESDAAPPPAAAAAPWEPALEAREKARDVEQVLQDGEAARRKALEAAEE